MIEFDEKELQMVLRQRQEMYTFLQDTYYMGYNSPRDSAEVEIDFIKKKCGALLIKLGLESGTVDLRGKEYEQND